MRTRIAFPIPSPPNLKGSPHSAPGCADVRRSGVLQTTPSATELPSGARSGQDLADLLSCVCRDAVWSDSEGSSGREHSFAPLDALSLDLSFIVGGVMCHVVSSTTIFSWGFLAIAMPRMSCCFEADSIISLCYQKLRIFRFCAVRPAVRPNGDQMEAARYSSCVLSKFGAQLIFD